MNIQFDTISKANRIRRTGYNSKKQNICFKSSELCIGQDTSFLERDFYRATTCPFRGNIGEEKIPGIVYDIDWEWWRNLLSTHFGEKNIVIHNMACSDGSEAYSHAITLLERSVNCRTPEPQRNAIQKILFPSNSEPGFRVVASDINPILIKFAKEHKINLDINDIYRIKNFSKSGKDYFTKIDDKPIDFSKIIPNSFEVSDWYKSAKTYSPSQEFQKIISFKNMDMMTHLKQISDKGNTVISCSNVFLYLTKDYTEKFIRLLLKKMKPGSIFKTGFSDINSSCSPLYRNHDLYKLLCSKMIKLNKIGTVLQMK